MVRDITRVRNYGGGIGSQGYPSLYGHLYGLRELSSGRSLKGKMDPNVRCNRKKVAKVYD